MSCCNGNGDDDSSNEAKPLPAGSPLDRLVYDPNMLVSQPCPPSTPVCVTPSTPSTTILTCGANDVPPSPCCNVCNVPLSTGCGCGSLQYRTQVPSYPVGRVCAEDNRKTIYIEKLVGSFKNRYDFGMPACDGTIKVLFDSVGDVPIGAWLWTFGIGYLTIVGFNPATGEITLRNDCPTGNCQGQQQAAPGTRIPACSVFVLLAPICSGASAGPGNLYPYLNAGFTAPEEGDCIDVAVTNVNGLSVNKTISIFNGNYRLSAIKSQFLITICNDGAGVTPGTPVPYQDSAGNLITPVILIDSNPCLNTPVLSGALLVCDSGVIKPLDALLDGQIPVWSEVSQNWSARSLGIPLLDCTALTQTLTLDPANNPAHSYLIQVQSTAAYIVSELVTIGGSNFVIDSIDSATNLHATPVVDPVVITNYPVGSTLCSASCCERLEAIEDRVMNNVATCGGKWLDTALGLQLSTPKTVFTITSTQDVNGNPALQAITNESCVRNLIVQAKFTARVTFQLNGVAGQYANITLEARGAASQTATLPPPALPALKFMQDTVSIPTGLTAAVFTREISYEGGFIIPPGETWNFVHDAFLIFNGGNVTNIAGTLDGIGSSLSFIGVSEF